MLTFNAPDRSLVRFADLLSDSFPMERKANVCSVIAASGLHKSDVSIKLFPLDVVIKKVSLLKRILLTNYQKRLSDNNEKVLDFSTCISIAHDDDC